jgi:hypothetical protein
MLAHYRSFVEGEQGQPWWPVMVRLGLRRRQLLEWLGWKDAKQEHVRLVEKVAVRGIRVHDVENLRLLSAEKTTIKMLRHLSKINAEVIRIIHNTALRSVASFSLLEEIAHMDNPPSIASKIEETVQLAKLHGISMASIKSCGKLDELHCELLDAEYSVISEWDPHYEGVDLDLPPTAPTIPRYTQSPGLHIETFRTARALFDWAWEERNCAFSMIEDVISKKIVLLKVLEPIRGTLALAAQEGSWHIVEFKATRNKPAPRDAFWVVAAFINKRLQSDLCCSSQ